MPRYLILLYKVIRHPGPTPTEIRVVYDWTVHSDQEVTEEQMAKYIQKVAEELKIPYDFARVFEIEKDFTVPKSTPEKIWIITRIQLNKQIFIIY